MCIQRPVGPAELAVVFCHCLRVSRILLHLHFRPPCSSAQGRFPSFSSCWGGVPWLLALICGSFWVFTVLSLHASVLGFSMSAPFPEVCFSLRLCWAPVCLGLTWFLCTVACFAMSFLLHVFLGQFLGPLGGYPFFFFFLGSPSHVRTFDWVLRVLFLSPELCSLQCFDIIFGSCGPFGLAGFLSLHGMFSLQWLRCSGRALCSFLSGPSFVLVPLPLWACLPALLCSFCPTFRWPLLVFRWVAGVFSLSAALL